jgi:hypothetical protein
VYLLTEHRDSQLGECNICGGYRPLFTMCAACEDQGGMYDGAPDTTHDIGICLECGTCRTPGEHCRHGCISRCRYQPHKEVPGKCCGCSRGETGRMGDGCSACGERRFRFDLTKSEQTGQIVVDDREGFTFLNQTKQQLPGNWILLDNQSTVNVFANKHLLRNIHNVEREMVIRCNAGVTRTLIV